VPRPIVKSERRAGSSRHAVLRCWSADDPTGACSPIDRAAASTATERTARRGSEPPIPHAGVLLSLIHIW